MRCIGLYAAHLPTYLATTPAVLYNISRSRETVQKHNLLERAKDITNGQDTYKYDITILRLHWLPLVGPLHAGRTGERWRDYRLCLIDSGLFWLRPCLNLVAATQKTAVIVMDIGNRYG